MFPLYGHDFLLKIHSEMNNLIAGTNYLTYKNIINFDETYFTLTVPSFHVDCNN